MTLDEFLKNLVTAIGLSWATMNYIADGTEKSFLDFSKF